MQWILQTWKVQLTFVQGEIQSITDDAIFYRLAIHVCCFWSFSLFGSSQFFGLRFLWGTFLEFKIDDRRWNAALDRIQWLILDTYIVLIFIGVLFLMIFKFTILPKQLMNLLFFWTIAWLRQTFRTFLCFQVFASEIMSRCCLTSSRLFINIITIITALIVLIGLCFSSCAPVQVFILHLFNVSTGSSSWFLSRLKLLNVRHRCRHVDILLLVKSMVVLLRYLNLLPGLFSRQKPIRSAIRVWLNRIYLWTSSLMSKTQQQLIVCLFRDATFLNLWLFLLFLISVISHIVFHLMLFHLLN